MAQITQLIEPISFERIRDQIATILLNELTNQATLTSDTELLFILNNTQIYSERFAPLNESEVLAIVVFFFASRYENQDPLNSDAANLFYLDFFGKSKASASQGADEISTVRLQRLIGMVYKILESPHYLTLGFAPPFIKRTEVVNIKRTEEEDTKIATGNMMYRMIFEVEAVESFEEIQPRELNLSLTNVELNETDLGFEYQLAV